MARLGHMVWQRDEFRIYRYRLADLPVASSVEVAAIRRDHAPDLDRYVPSAPWWLPKQAFLATARERIAAGEHFYTFATPERLLHYAWLADLREEMVVREVDQTFRCEPPGALLYDAYTLPDARGQGLHTRSVAARLCDARSIAGVRWAYVGCLAANRASRSVIEKAGFARYRSLNRLKVLGFARHW